MEEDMKKKARDHQLAKDGQPGARRAFVKGMTTAALGLIAAIPARAQGKPKKKSSGADEEQSRKRLQELGKAQFALERKHRELTQDQIKNLKLQITELEEQLESTWRDPRLSVCKPPEGKR
jgi:septal ring factor EnvC (AmiA/AmiB activator)